MFLTEIYINHLAHQDTMADKDEIAEQAMKVTDQSIAQLKKEGHDPDQVIQLTQRDIAHISSLSTTYTMLQMKEQIDKLQDVIKEYVLAEVAAELSDIDELEAKLAAISKRLDTVFAILDEHHEILTENSD